MTYRLGVDIGGTFTDLALLDEADGAMAIHKRLTTPDDPARSVLDGIGELLARQEVAIGEVTRIAHGTTLVTNAIIERRGGRTGMIATAGFRDVLDIGIESKYDLYALRLKYPRPFVPRPLQHEVHERIRHDGQIEQPLDADEVRRILTILRDEQGAVAVAVCLIQSFRNPQHEQAIARICREEFPELFVSVSSEVLPFMREYERWTTTTINAFTQPMVHRYLSRLEQGLAELGFRGHLHLMASNGGTITPALARRFPVRLLESGPAAGVIMSAEYSRTLALPNLLSFDMGGTTAKGSLIHDGQPLKQYELEVARSHEHRQGSGFLVRVPVIDMIEIGIGGGSIAGIDARGVIHVGPQSAGADPGPACYQQGGARPTVTDADLVLGYLDADYFLGGRMKLGREAAETAIRTHIADPQQIDTVRAAWGIFEIANESMARAFRLHASERGQDLRNFSVVGFGGNGPLHATRVARILHIPRVVLPLGAGVMSAFGLLVSPLSFETVLSQPTAAGALDQAAFDAVFAPLIEEAAQLLRDAGVPQEAMQVRRRLDMRYQGQGYEIEVIVPEGSGLAELPALFSAQYRRVFTTSFIEEPLEIVNWKVEVVAQSEHTMPTYRIAGAGQVGKAQRGVRAAYFPEAGGFMDCPVYDRYALAPGASITGPAIIEEHESTCLLGWGDTAEVDDHLSLAVKINLDRKAR